jgi:thymidylate synthase
MRQYLDAVKEVLEEGTRKENRTGVDTLSTFNINYEINLQQGFPLLTTKEISWKNIVVEMLWFLSGQTDISLLKRHGCKFWDAWADDEGRVPSAYGNFWRKFPVHREYHQGQSVWRDPVFNDQIKFVVDELKKNPMSRRMVVSAWAPGNAQTSKLPPCHAMFVVNVQNIKCATCAGGGRVVDEARECRHCAGQGYETQLCLHLTQRSCDMALGVPYNIASYALLLHLLSHFSGIPAGVFAHTLVDAHIYTSKPDGFKAEYDHVPGLRLQLGRDLRRRPRLLISDAIRSLEDVEALIKSNCSTDEVMSHFKLEGYDPHPAISFKVAV